MIMLVNLLQTEFKLRLLAYKLGKLENKMVVMIVVEVVMMMMEVMVVVTVVMMVVVVTPF